MAATTVTTSANRSTRPSTAKSRPMGKGAGGTRRASRSRLHVATSTPTPPASEAQPEALGQELAHQAPPVGAQREADADLATPRDGPRQEQVGHVGAGDEQDQAGHA